MNNLSGFATSMIGPCQEAKNPPDALGRSAGVFFSLSQRLVLASRPRLLSEDRTRLPFAGAASVRSAAQKIEFVFPARVKTNQREQRELALSGPVGLTARPGRPRAE